MASIIKVDTIKDTSDNTLLTSSSGNVSISNNLIVSGTIDGTINTPIAMVDAWRLTSDIVGGGSFVLTSGFGRQSAGTDGFGQIGTGLTESSGQFTFPQTGVYQINFWATFVNGGNDTSCAIYLNYTNDNFTSYSNVIGLSAGHASSGNSIASVPSASCILDITDTTNQKFHFSVTSLNSTIVGNTGVNFTGFTVIRLGDT